MCLAVPGQVTVKNGLLAKVEVGGILRDVSLIMVPEVNVGDYVLVHTGFAIEKIDQSEAEKTMALFKEMMGENEVC